MGQSHHLLHAVESVPALTLAGVETVTVKPLMRKTGLVIDPRFRAHETGSHHPESPERLEVLEDLLGSAAFADWPRIAARKASEEELRLVHAPAHLSVVAQSEGRAYTQFDGDTSASAGSFEAACLAAGAAIDLADAVVDGELASGFAALRPPGHHAERDHPMGFCLFNNVAIVAQHLRRVRGLARVLILDWDVHHGNGTQHSFYDDPNVLYVSLHQYPFYPGTGAATETGSGAGQGATVNVAMPAGCVGADYEAAFREVVLPAARRFDPDFVLISAGFDAHRADPLASMNLETPAYASMTDAMVALADDCAGGRIAMLLEGGYNLPALRDSVEAVLARLANPEAPQLDSAELGPWGLETLAALSGLPGHRT